MRTPVQLRRPLLFYADQTEGQKTSTSNCFPAGSPIFDEFLFDYLKDPITLGDTKYILVEIPDPSAEFAKETCFRIKLSGFIPMIAHPERCNLFAPPEKVETSRFRFSDSKFKGEDSKPNEPSLLDYLKDLGCAFQANLGSSAACLAPGATDRQLLKKNERLYPLRHRRP